MNTLEFLRQYRLFGYAIFDLVVSFLGIFLLSPLLTKIFRKMHIEIPRKSWLYLTLPIGILAHLLFQKITPMTRDFLDIHDNFVLKILISGLFILGLKDIKKIKK